MTEQTKCGCSLTTPVNSGNSGEIRCSIVATSTVSWPNGSSYGDGKPLCRFGPDRDCPRFAAAPDQDTAGTFGPRGCYPEIARPCGATVGQERPSGKPGGLFLGRATGRDKAQPRRAAARLLASIRRPRGGAIFSFIIARISGRALSGEPELNGGAGLYSSPSWISSAVGRSTMIETSVRAKSIPAVTPPPVMRLRSTQTRVFSGVAPNGASRSIAVQCVVAR